MCTLNRLPSTAMIYLLMYASSRNGFIARMEIKGYSEVPSEALAENEVFYEVDLRAKKYKILSSSIKSNFNYYGKFDSKEAVELIERLEEKLIKHNSKKLLLI